MVYHSVKLFQITVIARWNVYLHFYRFWKLRRGGALARTGLGGGDTSIDIHNLRLLTPGGEVEGMPFSLEKNP